jgi:hypothetical protein
VSVAALAQPVRAGQRAPLLWGLVIGADDPYRSLNHQAPLERLDALKRNNVLGSYI